jgi:hypothetical protein
MATSTTTPKGKYTESLTFSTPNCIYANYVKLGKSSLQVQLNFISAAASAHACRRHLQRNPQYIGTVSTATYISCTKIMYSHCFYIMCSEFL